jgi:threonine dehydrogenase-like Zn-dependent dehydrogenase
VSTEPVQDELVGIAIEAIQPAGAAVGQVDDASERSSLLLGRRVLIGPLDPCGQCDVCRRGGNVVCPLARHRPATGPRLRASSRWLVALGDGLELPVPAAAAVAGDVASAYTLYARTGLGPREPAVITGATAVTRFLVEILIAKDITPTVIVEPTRGAWRDEWIDWLLGKGVAIAHDAATATAAVAAQGLGARPWRLIATDALHVAAPLAGARATLTVLADRSLSALPGELLAREVTVIGVAGAHPDLVVEAAAMVVRGEIDLVGGVTSRRDDPTRAIVIAVTG